MVKVRLLRWFALIIAIAILPLHLTQAEESNDLARELKVSGFAPYAITKPAPADTPSGFEGSILLPLYALGVQWRKIPLPGRAAMFFNGNLSFTRSSMNPVVGINPGLGIQVETSCLIHLGVDVQIQNWIDRAPFKESQFDTTIGAAYGSLLYRALDEGEFAIDLGIELREILLTQSKIAGYEGLETEIEHNSVEMGSFWVDASGPVQTKLMGRLDLYFLGAAAIASKEFAYSIAPMNRVARWSIKAEKRFGKLGLEATFAKITGVRDPLELAFQAPFLTRDYLLSPQTLTLGISWNL